MATTDNAVQYDILFVEHFAKYLDLSKTELKAMKKLAEHGLIQRDRLLEIVTARVGGLNVVSIEGMDFCDGSDMKTCVSSMRNNDKKRGSWTNSFEIRSIGTKTGPLRIVAYNKLYKRFHYFFVPRYAYEHLKDILTITIESATCHHGTPNFCGIPGDYKFWNFECDSFEAMCDMREESLEEWELSK